MQTFACRLKYTDVGLPIADVNVLRRRSCHTLARHWHARINTSISPLVSPLASTPKITPAHLRTTLMASARDISHLSDISKLKTEEDGSFKRQVSQFRNFIEKGGDFEPEKGESWFLFPYAWVRLTIRPLDRYHLYVSYACRKCSAIQLRI